MALSKVFFFEGGALWSPLQARAGQQLTPEATRCLASAVRSSTGLNQLNLADALLLDEDSFIVQALQCNSSLESLDLKSALLSPSLDWIPDVLESNRNLSSVPFSCNRIGDAAVAHLFPALIMKG